MRFVLGGNLSETDNILNLVSVLAPTLRNTRRIHNTHSFQFISLWLIINSDLKNRTRIFGLTYIYRVDSVVYAGSTCVLLVHPFTLKFTTGTVAAYTIVKIERNGNLKYISGMVV